jgi:hypothetical protein
MFSFRNMAVIHAPQSRNTSLQLPQLQDAEGRSRGSFPRLVYKDIATKLGVNGGLVRSKAKGLDKLDDTGFKTKLDPLYKKNINTDKKRYGTEADMSLQANKKLLLIEVECKSDLFLKQRPNQVRIISTPSA